jgi:hypothetical protein
MIVPDAEWLFSEQENHYRRAQLSRHSFPDSVVCRLFSAVGRGLAHASRFLWIKDLNKPDGLLAFICASLIGLSAAVAPGTTEQPLVDMGLNAGFDAIHRWDEACFIDSFS